ncbi:MAG: TetR/AcrR family transcriptional regulator [Clostridia bacterium]|nr:TetR/AcrR family transcriptional regulator [Clostridia bacterium]
MNKNQSKYFNTAIRMDEALLQLLERKDFEYITVKEICDTAGVNRSTFYLHYQNTADLLKETTEYILRKHFEYFGAEKTGLKGGIDKLERKELIFVTHEYMVPYLTFIKENRRLFSLAIKHFHIMNMDKVYGEMFKYIFEPVMSRFEVPPQQRPYVIKFYLTGVFAIVMEWINNNCADEIELIIKTIDGCVLGERRIEK